MDIISINKLVEEQLISKGIIDGTVAILEKEWGYVVQIQKDKEYLNELLDKEGNIIYPLGDFQNDSGAVYLTELFDFGKRIIPIEATVRYKELDSNHFIIPRANEEKAGSALFFVNESKNVMYKGYINGRICGDALNEDKKLIQQKQVLSFVEIDKTRDKYEYFFYSWDKNCRISDKWSSIYPPKNSSPVRNCLNNEMKFPLDLSQEIIKYMQENGAYLATLKLNSKDNEHHMNFVCLIGLDGIPLIDLTYVSQTYSIETIQLKKQKIGEVDNIKTFLQERIDKKASQIEENKQNITTNFLNVIGLTMKNTRAIEDTTDISDDTNR